MEEHVLSPIQRHILDIMKVCLDIFEKENIHYYMQGGTMLGAVRHHGFIPWDDDMDIGLPRPDYEKFLKVCEKYLPENMKLRTYWDETEHHYYFARIVDTNYHIRRSGGLEERIEELWLDIFPLDGLPKNPVVNVIHKGRLQAIRLLYSLAGFEKINLGRSNRPLSHRMIIRFIYVTHINKLFSKISRKKCLDRIDQILKSCPVDQSNVLVNFMGDFHFVGYDKENCYGVHDNIEYEFEDIRLVGFKDYDSYLKVLYGDYMQLPPEDKRNLHVAKLIEEERRDDSND